MINHENILWLNTCGKLAKFCCLTPAEAFELKELFASATLAEMVDAWNVICGCRLGTTIPGLPDGGEDKSGNGEKPTTGDACTDAWNKLCANQTAVSSIDNYKTGLKALMVIATLGVTTPPGLAALASAKDYLDALDAFTTVCKSGKGPTKADIDELCTNHKAANDVDDYIPGMKQIMDKLNVVLGPVLDVCCPGWNTVNTEAGPSKYHDDWTGEKNTLNEPTHYSDFYNDPNQTQVPNAPVQRDPQYKRAVRSLML